MANVERASYDPHDPRQRYLHEQPFSALVDSFIAILDDGLLTRDDIRAALDLAVTELAPRRSRRSSRHIYTSRSPER